MTEQTGDLQVAFPKQTEGEVYVAPPLPAGKIEQGLNAYTEPAKREVLRCSNLLIGDTKAQAEAEAVKLYPKMLDNPAIFMVYGTEALEGINALVDRILREVGDVTVPELQPLMRDLNARMRAIKRNYDVSDPKVRQRSDKPSWLTRMIRKGQSLMDQMSDDIRSIDSQLDQVAKQLKGSRDKLGRNVMLYDELRRENEHEIQKLIYVIAVMECIRDLAVQDAQSIVTGNTAAGDRGEEQAAVRTDFVRDMEVKIAEYKGRLMVAWATSPQTRMMRSMQGGMAEKLNELINVTIPTMKLTLASWRMNVQGRDAGKQAQVVQDSSNAYIQEYTKSSAETVAAIANTINTPTLTPETISAMVDSIVSQTDSIIAATELGRQRRDDVDMAMTKARSVLRDTQSRLTEATIQSVVGPASKALQFTQSVL